MGLEPVSARRLALALGVSVAAACAVLVAAPLAGSTSIDVSRALAGESPHREILFAVRLPRVLLALLAGGALAVAGVVFQAMLRDALATPYTLGVSSGASLGAVLAIVFGAGALGATWLAALAGATLTLGLVLAVASEGRRMSSFTLLLAGVTVNSIVMALIMLLHSASTVGQSFAIVRWLMGGIDTLDYASLGWLAVVTLPVCLVLCRQARQWNLLAVGEEWAAARGASPQRLLRLGFLAGSALAASVTALTGPIGFVGLIIPHALRLRYGADHRLLLPCSFFWGGAFLVACDTLARTITAPVEIPVSVITALCGGPFFIALLRSRKRSLWL
jgi:iron complex transport system permease protein